MAKKRIFEVIAIVVALLVVFIGCGGNKSGGKGKENGSTATDSSVQMTAANGASKGEKAKTPAKGLNWTTLSAEQTGFVKLGETKDIYSVSYGNGKCVAISDSQIMSISIDGGKTWQAKTVKTPKWSSSASILYGNGCFVITSSEGVYFASEDKMRNLCRW